MRVVFVHGACVKDGSWWWHRTAEILHGHGISSQAPALPSCGETGDLPDAEFAYAADVEAVRKALLESNEPTTIVAHSYGGIVTAEAAAGIDSVAHLVLIASYLPEPGESLATFAGAKPAPFLQVDLDSGAFAVRPDMFVETFMYDCPPEIIGQSVEHLAAQSLSVTQQPVGTAAWKHIPTTYIVCAADRGTPADKQREFARRAGRVVELNTGHHPFLSHPDAVAGIILQVRSTQ